MLDYRIALGNAIKAARTELNLTQNEVADLINSDSRTILNIENYKGNPKMQKLFLLIRSLHIDPNIVFYPEKSVSSTEPERIKALLEQCSDEELSKMIPIIESVIRTIGSKTPE